MYHRFLLYCLATVTPLGLAEILEIDDANIYIGRNTGYLTPRLKRKLRPLMVECQWLPPARPARLKIRKDNPNSAAASIIKNMDEETARKIAIILATKYL